MRNFIIQSKQKDKEKTNTGKNKKINDILR